MASESEQARAALGLPAWHLAAILGISVLVFLFYGGPLWLAPPGASHLWRIAVSYGITLPLTALALRGRFTWPRLGTATLVLWSAKLLVTSSLYFGIAPGAATTYTPDRPWQQPSAAAPVTPAYRAAGEGAARGSIHGTVRTGDARAVVYLALPPPGRPIAPGPAVRIEISDTGFASAAYVAMAGDALTAVSTGDALHVLRVSKEGRDAANLSLPVRGQARMLEALAAGEYRASCATHPSERAVLVVVDHPYAAVTDAEGRFVLSGTPVGELDVVAVSVHARDERRIELERDDDLELTLELRERIP